MIDYLLSDYKRKDKIMAVEIDNNEFKCPTCGKVQEWRATCKLCGSGVAQLWELAIKYKKLKKRLRVSLIKGNFLLAEEIAQKITEISPTSLNKKVRQFVKNLITNHS
ncbi:MAG: hypothetical protein LBB88_05775 [Planctomycetaceae bacterium]|jgi:hypothetical protein|nr:hypothetical protein [Planctomycetaceae bacterium]